jgi:hypothetical protein
MPWFQEIEFGRALARAEPAPRLGFFEGIERRDPDELRASFAEAPLIEDPRTGRVSGPDEFRSYVANTREWLSSQGEVERVDLVVGKSRSVEEVAIHSGGGEASLPVAIATALASDGRLEAIRLYYGRWQPGAGPGS